MFGSGAQAHGRVATFVPDFGVSIADAFKASCSAYPFIERTIVRSSMGEDIELIDGGYCANNPTLYAIADAVQALKREHWDIRLVSVGVGVYAFAAKARCYVETPAASCCKRCPSARASASS